MDRLANALDPTQLGNDLQLQPGSPARGAGIDPSTLAGLNPSIASDLRRYIYTDINGNPRPQGSNFDLGAAIGGSEYEEHSLRLLPPVKAIPPFPTWLEATDPVPSRRAYQANRRATEIPAGPARGRLSRGSRTLLD